DDVLELNVAMAEAAKVPEPSWVGEADVPAEHADGAVAVAPPDVLHVDVEDPLAERADELDVIDALVAQVRWVVVEAETLVALDGVDGALGAGGVERDLGRVDLQPEIHALLLKRV